MSVSSERFVCVIPVERLVSQEVEDLQLFTHAEFGKIRVVYKEGTPWFVAKDVCGVLGTNAKHIGAILDSDEHTKVASIDHSCNLNDLRKDSSLVNESGLYSLILRSRKPEAKKFKKWVTSVVLPSIRKDGGYIMGEEKVATHEMSEDELLLKAMTILNTKVERLTAERDQLKSRVEEHLEFQSVAEWCALQHMYTSKGVKAHLGRKASKAARERGIPINSEERVYMNQGQKMQGRVNVYPVALLDEIGSRILRVN